jgi:uncharacterized protein (TIGR03437 family)
MRLRIRLGLAGLAVLIASTARAQSLTYTLLGAAGQAPPARYDAPIAYDPVDRQVFVFGGQDRQVFDDLWAYSLRTRQWREVQVSGERPAARFGHTLIFDPVRRRVVVFAGQARGFFGDVWAFDLAGNAWRRLSPDDSGPSRRYGHSAIYDPVRDRMVISHGFTNAGRFDDTWAFEFSSNIWRDLSPSGARPLRRCLHHAAYDPAGGQMFLYGGCASGFGPCPLGDLWSFDLAANRWTEVTPSSRPEARERYGLAFDAVRGRLVLFGGRGARLLNDTWEFDPGARAWSQAAITGALPSPRDRHEAAYALDRGTAFFFGGSTDEGASNQLWMLGPAFVGGPAVAGGGVANAFSGQGGAVAPGELVSIYGSGLGPLEGVAFQFDPVTGLLPKSGPGVDVKWNGIASPLLFARSDQINVQVPYELSGASEASLVVTVNGQTSDAVSVPVSATRPGLFPRVWNQDGTVNSADNPAGIGSIVVLYATGQGVTSPSSPTGARPGDVYPEPAAAATLTLGGVPAEILFRGQAPGTAGVMQINARIPQGMPAGAHAVLLRVGLAESQAGISVWIR